MTSFEGASYRKGKPVTSFEGASFEGDTALRVELLQPWLHRAFVALSAAAPAAHAVCKVLSGGLQAGTVAERGV